MDKEKGVPSSSGWKVPDIHWRAVGLGYGIALLATLLAGLPLLIVADSSWLMALSGSAGLLLGGALLGAMAGPALAVINGALIAILYNLTISLAFLAGSFLEILPEPLPGLPQGDSTFFFAWPLAQFAIGILSAILGSRFASKRHGRAA